MGWRTQTTSTSFARRAVTIVAGAAGGQVVVLAATPLITRLYDPSDFGLLGVFAAILGICAVVSALRYEFAIPLESDDTEATRLALACLAITAMTSSLAGVAILFIGADIAAWVGVPRLSSFLWLLPIGIALSGTYQTLTFWNIREHAYHRIASTRLVQGVSMAAVQLSLGMAKIGPIGLVLGQIAGTTGGIFTLSRHFRPKRNSIGIAQIVAAAGSHLRFPIYSAPAALLNSLVLFIPAIGLAAMYGPITAGLYVLVQRVLSAPMNLVGQSVAQVYFGDSAESLRRGDLEPISKSYFSISWRLAAVSLVIVAPMMFAGPSIFAAAFGEEWRTAGTFARWLSLPFALQLVTSPLSQTLNLVNRQRWQLIWDTIRATAVVLVFTISAKLDASILATIAAYGGVTAFMYIVLWLLGWQALKRPCPEGN